MNNPEQTAIDLRKKLGCPIVQLSKETRAISNGLSRDSIVYSADRGQIFTAIEQSGWASHHRESELLQIGGVRIAFMEVSNASELDNLERQLIDRFSPALNRQPVKLLASPKASSSTKLKGRKRKEDIPVRCLIRVDEEAAEIYQRYSQEERNEVFNRALKSVFPEIKHEFGYEQLICPTSQLHKSICLVVVDDGGVQVSLPEFNDDFRGIVKKFGYAWDRGFQCWVRVFAHKCDVVGRASEIATELLLGGFCVKSTNKSLTNRIVNEEYSPEVFNKVLRVTSAKYKDWFTFRWEKGEDWYKQIMQINLARYDNGSIYVPSSSAQEVEDFADMYEFEISEAAAALVAEAKTLAANALIPQTVENKTRKAPKKNERSNSNEIPTHLRDDADD
jgi:hypothetical protein